MRRFVEVAASLSLAAAVGCAGDVKTIDRTQPNALDKTMFDGIWYHQATIVSANPESGHTEGIRSGSEKLRWEITETMLIGYRSYEFVPYAEGLTDEGRDFFGAPVVAFPILSHFDIQREYNATTGVENNVIVENTTDRPWNERRYMRVNWQENRVGSETPFLIGFVNYPTAYFNGYSTGSYVQGDEATNPDRPFITRDYFDVTNVYRIDPDVYYCSVLLLSNSVGRCGTGNVRVRLSFKKIDPRDDYESLYYPDTVELKDDDGNAIITNFDGRRCDDFRDPGECTVQNYPYDARFGNFRIVRPAFDRERSLTRTGRMYAAGRFDLWKDSYNDADGALIPYAQREPQPIVYYGNVNFPDDMIEPAQRLASHWNKPFMETVAMLQGDVTAEGKPNIAATRARIGFDMFQFRQNDCNVENVKRYARENDLVDVVEGITGNIERVTRGNLPQVCAAIQFADLQNGKTLDPKDGRPLAFTWQRTGDLRYNFQNYVDPVQANGPWGVAQFGQDPETGEFFANTANYFGASGDSVAQSEVDLIQWLNGDLSEEELFRGDFTRATVVSRRADKNNNVRDVVASALRAHEDGLLEANGDALFRESAPGEDDARFERMFKGSSIERELLVNDEILRAFAGPTLYQPFGAPAGAGRDANPLDGFSLTPGAVSEEALAAASPVSWGVSVDKNPYLKMVEDFGSRGYELAEFFDPNTSGLADAFKGSPREEIYEFIRREMYASVQSHEVGHTLGLRHNFEASMDPLNYRPEFWYKLNADGSVTQYWNNQPKEGNAHRGNEYKYASIMDYGFDVPLEGLHGIGLYDEAAIRFMYGQLVDVWDPQAVSIPDPRKYSSWARRCGQDSDYWGLQALLDYLGPESYPSLFVSTPRVKADGSPCVPEAPRRDARGLLCTDDPSTPIDEGAVAPNFDASQECDSEIDSLYRELAVSMEATASSIQDVSSCALFFNISDINSLFANVQRLYPNPSNDAQRAVAIEAVRRLTEGRKPVPVAQLISQKIQTVLNVPEHDIAGTDVDESRNCRDDDGDGEVDDKGYDWSKFLHEVDYDYCSDLYANTSNPRCQRWDAGWDFLEATENHINRYDRDYVFDHFRRDRSNWGNPRSFMARLEGRRFINMTNVFRYYLYTRRSAFDVPLYKDWAAAAYKGLNFLERVLQTPEPGRYCLNRAENEYELDRSGVRTDCEEPFEVGLGYGQGKFLDTSWTNDYEYRPNRIGAFYDKVAALRQLTASSGYFVRDASDLFDRRAFSLGYMRVFEDPLIQRFSALIQGDHEGYRSAVQTEANGEKFVRYMPFFDEAISYGTCTPENASTACASLGGQCDAAPGQTGTCVNGSMRTALDPLPKIEPAWSWTLQYYALFYGIGNWSSINDLTPEFYRFTKIAVKGTPEDANYPANVPIVEFTDPETRVTYRAPDVQAVQPPALATAFPAYYGDSFHRARGQARNWGIGADILRRAATFVNDVYNPLAAACPDQSVNSQACQDFRTARRRLNEQVGFIDIVRRFDWSAEFN